VSWPGPRIPVDLTAYTTRVRTGPCFVCGIVAGAADQPEEVLHRDGLTITFLARPGVLPGHTLVAPVRHLEGVVADFGEDEYAALQRRVWQVGRAVSAAVSTERLYVLSLGSQQGNRHVHWHLVPLPPGVPYAEQQFAVFDLGRLGTPDVPVAERAALADRIRERLSGGAP
jgi:histidine triad (HIT) family protein